MRKTRAEINPIRAERLKILLNREKITQTQLADALHFTQQHISSIIRQHNALTEETAKAVISLFPAYRLQWLMGFDDIMLHTDEITQMIHNEVDTADAITMVINLVADDICKREGIDRPFIPFIPDFSELQNRLRDYAELILYDYLMNRKNSRTWRRIDNEQKRQGGEENETGKR